VKIGVTGVIPLGTTGESPTIDEEETERIVERTVAVVAGRVPIVVGVSGNDTRKAVKAVKRLQRHPIQGVLAVYHRPGQDGMRELHHARPRRRRGHPGRPRGDRGLSGGVRAHGRQRSPGRPQGVVARGAAGAAALQGAEPEPIKHCLWRQGLIGSPECRLPLTRVSEALAAELERALAR